MNHVRSSFSLISHFRRPKLFNPSFLISSRFISRRGGDLDPDGDSVDLTAEFRKAINDPRFENANDAALVWHTGANADDAEIYEEGEDLLPLENTSSRQPLKESLHSKMQFKKSRISTIAVAEAYARADAHGNRKSAPKANIALRRKIEKPNTERIRVLDVDRLPLNDLHHLFAYTLVRRLPAEECVKIASRVARFRDVQSQRSYEALLRNCTRTFGAYAPELLALFTRCYQTVSVAYLLDYTRRFGTFSRRFIAEELEKSLNTRYFDFVRYEAQGGRRPIPGVVAKPFALSSYVKLMGESSTKQSLLQMLEATGSLPATHQVSDEQLEAATRMEERIATSMEERTEERQRPLLMDHIIAAEYAGVTLDEYFLMHPEIEDPRKGEKPKVPDIVSKHLNSLESDLVADAEEEVLEEVDADFEDTAADMESARVSRRRAPKGLDSEDGEWLMDGGDQLDWLEDLDDDEIFREGGDVTAKGVLRDGRRPLNVREGVWRQSGVNMGEETFEGDDGKEESLMSIGERFAAGEQIEKKKLAQLKKALLSPSHLTEDRDALEEDEDESRFQEALRLSHRARSEEESREVLKVAIEDDAPFREAMARITDIERRVEMMALHEKKEDANQSAFVSEEELAEHRAFVTKQGEWLKSDSQFDDPKNVDETVASQLPVSSKSTKYDIFGEDEETDFTHISAHKIKKSLSDDLKTQQNRVQTMSLPSNDNKSSEVILHTGMNDGSQSNEHNYFMENGKKEHRWWTDGREDHFFRHDKKAYRLTDDGWKQSFDKRPSGGKPRRKSLPREVKWERHKISKQARESAYEEAEKLKN